MRLDVIDDTVLGAPGRFGTIFEPSLIGGCYSNPDSSRVE